MTQISKDLRSDAFVTLRARMSRVAIDMLFNSQPSTNAMPKKRFQATRTVRDRQWPGQPKITAHLQDGTMRMLHSRRRFRSVKMTYRHNMDSLVRNMVFIIESYFHFKFKQLTLWFMFHYISVFMRTINNNVDVMGWPAFPQIRSYRARLGWA